MLQALHQTLELPLAHGAFLVDAVAAFGEHRQFAILRQQLHADARAYRLPGQGEEGSFQFGEPAPRRADQVVHRRIGRAHAFEHFLGGNAAVHHPDPFRSSVLRFDLLQEHLERGLVGGVARQHFVGDGETLRGHDQGNDDLHAVAPLVAAVAKTALVLFVLRRGDSK